MGNTLKLNWVKGEHDFALNIGELRALQESCDAGPELILNRLRMGSWLVDDIFEVLRLGLIGAGTSSKDAVELVKGAIEEAGFVALKLPAYQILGAALMGDSDDPVGEDLGVNPSETSGSSQNSTA